MDHRLLWLVAKTQINKCCRSLDYYLRLGRANLIALALSLHQPQTAEQPVPQLELTTEQTVRCLNIQSVPVI